MASGMVRGRVLSPATIASRKHGDLSCARLVNISVGKQKGIRAHISLMSLDINVNWQLSKQETNRLVSYDHIVGSHVVSEDAF